MGKNMLQWSEKECIDFVNSYPDGQEINFSKLAREHFIINKNGEFPKNGGQMLKDFLEKKSNKFIQIYKHAQK